MDKQALDSPTVAVIAAGEDLLEKATQAMQEWLHLLGDRLDDGIRVPFRYDTRTQT